MLKKIFYTLIIVIFIASVYSGQSAKDISLPDLESQFAEQTDLNSMKKCTDKELLKFIGLDHSTCSEYLYYKGTDALSVSELLVAEISSKSNLQAARDLVDSRISSQIKTFDSYGPSQVAMLKNALIIQKGQYIFYYVGENGSKFEEVFRNAI